MKADVLKLDCEAEVARIGAWMKRVLARDLRKRGVVLGLSGGVDSSVCAALAARELGPKHIFGILMPETESASISTERGHCVAEQLGIPYELKNIGSAVAAIGCYELRDRAIRELFPDFGEGWLSKVVIAGGTQGGVNYFKLVVQSPFGVTSEVRMPIRQYLQVVAATSFKQRTRKMLEYFHADRLNFAVLGTPNRLEYDQGFFVKNGDGAADLKPIAHLYKTQVYALARYLGLPEQICSSVPTTDTYSMQQGQDEFYFALPYQQMDYALWAHNNGIPAPELAEFLDLSVERVTFVYDDISAKRRATRYLHAQPHLVEPIGELAS